MKKKLLFIITCVMFLTTITANNLIEKIEKDSLICDSLTDVVAEINGYTGTCTEIQKAKTNIGLSAGEINDLREKVSKLSGLNIPNNAWRKKVYELYISLKFKLAMLEDITSIYDICNISFPEHGNFRLKIRKSHIPEVALSKQNIIDFQKKLYAKICAGEEIRAFKETIEKIKESID